MQTVSMNTQIPRTPLQLGAGIKSVSILRNGQFDAAVRDDSVERWLVTDLLEHTSYTVTRHGESYAVTLVSGDEFIVADVEGAADIPDVVHRLVQFATPS